MGPLGVVTFQSDHGSLLLPLGGVFSFIIWGWGGKVNQPPTLCPGQTTPPGTFPRFRAASHSSGSTFRFKLW